MKKSQSSSSNSSTQKKLKSLRIFPNKTSYSSLETICNPITRSKRT